jgi:hypothetical protein
MVVFLGLAVLFYFLPIPEVDTIFLTVSTFLFTIFAGFFISRQGSRYSKIRETVASFDGELSAIYRFAGHLGGDFQKKVEAFIKKHYKKILKNQEWDYHFTHKSDTLTSLHASLDDVSMELTPVQSNAVGRITFSLAGLQKIRKQMVALHQERIDSFQWFLIYFFMLILVIVVATIPSYGVVLPSILKAAFAVSVISVVTILWNLDNLRLFEGVIGEHSAHDVLDIIAGKK